MLPPKLDTRTLQEIVDDCKALAGVYTPDWTGFSFPNAADPARGVADLFARLYELLLERFNSIPEKNFLSFLDLVGVEQFPGRPAEAPITFLLSDKALAGEFIPAGSQIATPQSENADAEVFETRGSFFATASNLAKIVNLVPKVDAFSEIALPELPPPASTLGNDSSRAVTSLAPDATSLLAVDHVLFLGSSDIFGRKDIVDVSLLLVLTGSNASFTAANLVWKRFNAKAAVWVPLIQQPVYDRTQPGRVTILFSSLSGIAKSSVDGVEDFWLACYFTADFTAVTLPQAVTAATGTLAAPVGSTSKAHPDSAFLNANRLDTSKPFFPFGARPAYADAFYFSSAIAFAPEIGSVTLTFTIRPYTDAAIKAIFAKINATATVSTKVSWQYMDNNGSWRNLATYTHDLTVVFPALTVSRNASGAATGEDGTLFGLNGASTAVVKIPNFPSDIGLREMNGEPGYWLRALLQSDNPYGGDAFVVMNGAVPVVVGPTYMPPAVEDVEIQYAHRTDPVNVQNIRSLNNFESVAPARDTSGKLVPFAPFVSLTNQMIAGASGVFAPEPALYFGFDFPFGQVFISFLVHLAETVSAATFPLETGDPQIAWEYLNPALQWKPLEVVDGTQDLRTTGVVSFLAPEDSVPRGLFPLLFPPGDTGTAAPALCWYRARLTAGKYDHPPRVLGLYLNTVMATNLTTHREDPTADRAELLIGSATGDQNQTVNLIQRPVLSGQLWVREPEIPGLQELKDLLDDFLNDEGELSPPSAPEDLYEVRIPDTSGAEPEVWVRWKRVPNFLSSTPRSRHYTLQAVSGTLTFGDSSLGLIPPVGKDSLRIRDFQTGGGEAPNQSAPALAIQELKTSFPFVDQIFNVQKAEGGADPWSLAQTLEFGPQIIKNRGRAVTTEDYEWMVRQEFSQAARVRCLATRQPAPGGGLSFKPGAVTLIIVPKSTERLPEPSQRLLTEIREFLGGKALGNIVSDIFAVGPDYKEVRIEATIVPIHPEEASVVARRVVRALEDFLHPLTGGEKGTGWEFGRSVFLSEIFAVMERTEGVDHVVSAQFPDTPPQQSVAVPENSLAASGSHVIHIG